MRRGNAAIAQPVERILGKDEVASSNLASSSKTLKLLEFRGFFLVFVAEVRPHPFSVILVKGCGLQMRSKIYFPEQGSETFEEVYSSFIISQTSKGVAAVTIRNYHLHLRSISKHLDINVECGNTLDKRRY